MLGENIEDSMMLIDPEILKKELVISLPILTESDIEMMLNVGEPSSDLSTSDEDEKEKPCLKRDQRRMTLLNNPDYGIVLSFLDKFRSQINIKKYSLRIFEDNLICEKEKISGRFMDFHLALLKKISPGKFVERNQFVENMKKFAYRFDRDDGDHLNEHGYAKAKIETKLRILKNLLELQFDRNQALKNAVVDKSASDISPKPFGRDRFGGSYWLFTDTDCFVRLFREDIDENRTWINLSKNSQELESIIKLLISDYLVRKKFPNWTFSKESFKNVPISHKFEDEYGPNRSYMKEKNEESGFISVVFRSTTIKAEQISLNPVVNLDREIPTSPPISMVSISNVEVRRVSEDSSDQGSIGSEIINGNRLSISSSSSSSNDTKDETDSNEMSQGFNEKEEVEKSKDAICSSDVSKEGMETEELEKEKDEISSNDTSKDVMKTDQQDHSPKINNKNINENIDVILKKPLTEQGIKCKLVDYDDSESDLSSEKTEEESQNSQEISVNNDIPNDHTELPIALRRPRRSRRSILSDQSADSSSTNKSVSDSSRKKKSIDRNWKGPSQSSRSRSRRRRNRKPHHGCSSSTSDERHPSEDDFSDESFPKNPELDKFLTGDLLEENNEEDDSIPYRQAKTVAQFQDLLPTESISCIQCTKTDRPELLLLCEDCNDAYHLECLQPELLAIPNDDWYCPLCEHKRLCDKLIDQLALLIRDEEQMEMRRRLNISKRRKRLTNVTVNLDRFVGETEVKKPQPLKKTSSIDDDVTVAAVATDKTNVKQTNSTVNDDDDDVDSVYGCKNDENRKPSDQEEPQENGKRRLRSCRRKAQNYSLDDYDKKIKAAMIDAGINKDFIENDSEDSDNVSLKRKPSKKRTRYELDEDFDVTDSKNGDNEFIPRRRRTTTTSTRIVDEDSRTMTGHSRSINDDSRSDGRDNDDYNDYGVSDEEIGWRSQRQSSVSSITKKKSKSKSKSTPKNQEHKSLIISDEDTIPYDPNDGDIPPLANVKNEPTTEFAQNEFPGTAFGGTEIVKNIYNKNRTVENVVYTNEAANINKPRRPQRAARKKKPKIQEENISDEEEKSRPPPTRRLPAKKRRGSNDSSLDDADDDYERLVHKRRLFSHGKAIVRSSITGHIKRLLGQEDDEEDEEEEEEEEDGGQEKNGEEKNGEEKNDEEKKNETKKDKNKNNAKKVNNDSQYDELRLSDDDDFPDEEEILKTTGLLNLKNPPINGQKAPAPVPVRVPFMPSMQSYQFAMIDPTAQFEFTCLPEEPITQPSDSELVNGANNPSNGS